MNIWIDIDRAIGFDGKAAAYYATAHWNIDEQDTIDQKDLDLIVKNVADIINDGLSMSKNITHKTTVMTKMGLEPVDEKIVTDPLTKEITVTKRYRVD